MNTKKYEKIHIKSHLKKSLTIQEEEPLLPTSSSKILITTRRSRNFTLLSKVCSLDRLSSVERKLSFRLVTSFLLDRSLKVISFLTLSSEKVTMVSLPEPLELSSLSLPTLKMVWRSESNFHLVSERLLIESLEL